MTQVAQVVLDEGYMVQVATERGTVVVNGEIEVPTRGLGDQWGVGQRLAGWAYRYVGEEVA